MAEVGNIKRGDSSKAQQSGCHTRLSIGVYDCLQVLKTDTMFGEVGAILRGSSIENNISGIRAEWEKKPSDGIYNDSGGLEVDIKLVIVLFTIFQGLE